MRADGADKRLVKAGVAQQARRDLQMLLRPFLIVDVVQQPDQSPVFHVLAEAGGKAPHDGLHGVCMLEQGVVVVVLPEQGERLIARFHAVDLLCIGITKTFYNVAAKIAIVCRNFFLTT